MRLSPGAIPRTLSSLLILACLATWTSACSLIDTRRGTFVLTAPGIGRGVVRGFARAGRQSWEVWPNFMLILIRDPRTPPSGNIQVSLVELRSKSWLGAGMARVVSTPTKPGKGAVTLRVFEELCGAWIAESGTMTTEMTRDSVLGSIDASMRSETPCPDAVERVSPIHITFSYSRHRG